MPSAVIGALRVDLNLGTAGWSSGLKQAASDAETARGRFQSIGGSITKTGAALTAGVTAPLVGLAAAAVRTAGNFEASMIKLGIATQATSQQMSQMNDLALELGKSTVFSASEAAGAMEELAKNGVSTANILGGAAKAAVDLAAAAGSELAPAAVAVSDAMNQFHLQAKDLPALVNQITGAVNESKLDFEDYQLGMAQAGGVAGAVGVSFSDFNAVLAGTSSMFSSGSDAGTSFKTFLGSLNPKSKEAAAAIAQYGLSFYDAAGKMRPMADIAEQLRTKLGGLSDEAKSDVLKKIFGQDAMRTAVGLMNLGAKGLDDISAKIAKTDAAAQSAQRMTGLNSQLEQLGGTLETLAIRIGQTGLLTSVTSVVAGITDMLDRLTQLSPAAAQVAVVIAAVAAAIGPIMLVVGPLVSGIGSLIGLFSGWGAALGASAAAAGGFGALLAPVLPIIAAVAGAVALAYAAWQHWDDIAPILSGLWNSISSALGPPLISLFATVKGALLDLWNGPFGALLQEVGARVVVQLGALGEKFGQLGSLIAQFASAAANILGPVLKGVFGGFVAFVAETLRMVGDLLNSVAALLQGDFAGAWAYAKKAVTDGIGGVGRIIEAMVPGALDALGRLVDGVRDWMVGKLGAIWNTVESGVNKVKGLFFGLYDAVVGHSYVPDMVDGIQAQMARLDEVMVQPTSRATSKVAKGFRDLASELRPVLENLFPTEAAVAKLEKTLALIERARAAGPARGGLSNEQADEARRRAQTGDRGDGTGVDRPAIVVEDRIDVLKGGMDDLKKGIPELGEVSKKTTAEMVEGFASMARDVLGSLRGMVSAFKGGDILGGLSGLLDIVTQVAGLIGGNKSGRTAVTLTGGTPSYGGGRALGGPVVPGKRYRVGESGRPEWFEPSVPGRITPSDGGGRAGTVNHFTGNLLTPEWWAMIQAGDDAAATRGAVGGRALAQQAAAAARARYLG